MRFRILQVLFLGAVLSACDETHTLRCSESPVEAAAAAPDWHVYYGNLHSHSSISDGVETPDTAFAWARDEGHLNFLCLSEHNHIYKPENEGALSAVVKKAGEDATRPDFVGLVGQEFSTLPPNGGNHVNVYDVWERVPAALNNDYRQLFRTWLPGYAERNPTAIVVCQFNHPDNLEHDYGISRIGGFPNYDGNWGQFVGDLDPWVRLIAILSGPADSNLSKTAVPPRDQHRDTEPAMIRIWQTYLEKGFHLSPVADQDNHRKSWGSRTTARTGVWIDGALTRQSLLGALKAGRTFATEDKNLSVWFTLNGKPMGSRLADPGAGDLHLLVKVDDADEPGSKYSVHLFRDQVGDGALPIEIEPAGLIQAGQTWTTTIEHQAGRHELFFIHVDQEESPDDAWTAPIWVDPALTADAADHDSVPGLAPGTKFVGSKNSQVYHYPECKTVKQILPQNLVEYPDAPAGKHLHAGCPN